MSDKIGYTITLRDAGSVNLKSDGFQVYDNGDLVLFDKNPDSVYEFDNIAAFGRGTWLWISKA